MKKLNIQKDVQSRESIARAGVHLPAKVELVVEPSKVEIDDNNEKNQKPTSDQASADALSQKKKTRRRQTKRNS